MSKNPFQSTGIARIPRASFDLSHSVAMTQKFGELVPLPPIECVPGDVFDLGISGLIRANPLVTPPFARVKLRSYSFFIPYRIIDDNFEEFFTRGEDGNSVLTLPVIDNSLTANAAAVGSLWDYFGWPLVGTTLLDADAKPLAYPHRAYWMIWNDFFRIPGIQNELVPDFTSGAAPLNWQWAPATRNFTRDYFTSALPWAQRGTAPALPVFGTANVDFDLPVVQRDPSSTAAAYLGEVGNTDVNDIFVTNALTAPQAAQWKENLDRAFNLGSTVDGSSFTSVDINDLRLAWQTQVWLERNARAGARFTEQLLSHFGRSPRDERLQRPEFIGGTVSDVMFSEVVQTSETDTTPQGKLAGHGIGSLGSPIGKYRVLEPGVIMTMVCLTPEAVYHQGIPRNWLRRTTFDFYFPEFSGLGEQEIFNAELYCAGDTADMDIFGYTGRYNELRYIPNSVHGLLRPGQSLAQWTMARNFSARPTLSSAFVNMAAESASAGAFMRPFVVTDPAATPPWICQYAHLVTAHRPLPYLAEPSPVLGG